MALGSWSPVRMRAATEESAISQALMIVGAARDEVSVEVIEKSDKGVTVRVSPRIEPEPQAQPALAQSTESIEDQLSDALASSADDEAPELAEEEVAEAVRDLAEEPQDQDEAPFVTVDAGALQQITEDEAALEPTLESTLEPALFEDESGSQSTQAPSEVLAQEIEDASTYSAPEEPSEMPSQVPDEVRERARASAQEMLDRMGLQVSAGLSARPFSAVEAGDPDAERRVYVTVEGTDVSILIGKHGATLQSFQYLLNLTLNNRVDTAGTPGEEAVRVVVDAGGYRSRRAEMLERMATETAERARRENRPVRMESMPAHERRLVHMFLRDDASLSTSSQGREPQRFVVVAPAGQEYLQSYDSSRSGSRGGSGGRGFGGNRRGRR